MLTSILKGDLGVREKTFLQLASPLRQTELRVIFGRTLSKKNGQLLDLPSNCTCDGNLTVLEK